MCIVIAKRKKPFVHLFSVLSHANPSLMVISPYIRLRVGVG
jgi:hypothetical protein